MLSVDRNQNAGRRDAPSGRCASTAGGGEAGTERSVTLAPVAEAPLPEGALDRTRRRAGRHAAAGAQRPARVRAVTVLAVLPLTLLLPIGLQSCGDPATPAVVEMEVARVFPQMSGTTASGMEAPRVFLNQDLTVYFSAPVDPLSVTSDTFRVRDANGNRVEGEVVVGTRSVRFVPTPPVTASLDDGSFLPDTSYSLEVTGLPLWNAMRSTNGRRLDTSFRRTFRTVRAQPTDQRFASPFLPVGSGTEVFALQDSFLGVDDFEWRMAANTGRLELHCTLPVHPTSATPAAAALLCPRDGRVETIKPSAVHVLPRRSAPNLHYGATVAFDFDPGELRAGAPYYLQLSEDPEFGLRDYLDRPIVRGAQALAVRVHPGAHVGFLSLGDGSPWRLATSQVSADLQFVVRGSVLEPLCVVEGGNGELGLFRPQSSLTIRPGEPFDRGDGVLVRSRGGELAFSGIEIPARVTVRVESAHPLTLRSASSCVIHGRLELATPTPASVLEPNSTVAVDQVLRDAGCSLVVGGDVRVHGEIRHVDDTAVGAPCAIVLGGVLEVHGRLPTGVVIAREVRRPVLGAIERPVLLETALTRGLAPGAECTARASTEWLPLPTGAPRAVTVELVEPRGDIQVWAQFAPAHSVDPTRPDLESSRLEPPLRLDQTLSLPATGFVRFEFRSTVRPGSPLPSLRGLRVLER